MALAIASRCALTGSGTAPKLPLNGSGAFLRFFAFQASTAAFDTSSP
jgi:hypothetical protein